MVDNKFSEKSSVPRPPNSLKTTSKYNVIPDEFVSAVGSYSNPENPNDKLNDDDESCMELYQEAVSPDDENRKPWWRSNFNLSSPVLFGAWDGVFTSCMVNIFGVVIFLRTGWVVGNAGIIYSIIIILLTESVAVVTVLSAIGISHKSRIICTGGVYTLISHVLGSRIATPIALLYCFGQAISCSLCVLAFGESIVNLLGWNNVWIERLIACSALLLILGVAVLGVTWIIGLQILLIVILFIAILDFIVGSFITVDHPSGVVGYNKVTFLANLGPLYVSDENFFTVLGVFFPMSCGVLAGFNMSTDVKNPPQDIPKGSLGAIGISTAIYLLIGFIMSATCERGFLISDYMIAEKISGTHILWLIGLYELSLSSAVGNLNGCPQALQGVAADQVFKIFNPLAIGRGPNQIPVFATAALACVSLIFVLIGQLNNLSQITTILFLLTYATVNYAYFLLSMSIRQQRISGDGSSSSFDGAGKKSVALIGDGGVKDGRKLSSIMEDESELDLGSSASSSSTAATTPTTGNSKNIKISTTTPSTSTPPSTTPSTTTTTTTPSTTTTTTTATTLTPTTTTGVTSPAIINHIDFGTVTMATTTTTKASIANDNDNNNDSNKSVSYDNNSYVNNDDDHHHHHVHHHHHDDDDNDDAIMEGGLNNEITSMRVHKPKPFSTLKSVSEESLASSFEGDEPTDYYRLAFILQCDDDWKFASLCSPWISLIGAIACTISVFFIDWRFASLSILLVILIWFIINVINPGVFAGVAKFSYKQWFVDHCCCLGKKRIKPKKEIILHKAGPKMKVKIANQSIPNTDFPRKWKSHKVKVINSKWMPYEQDEEENDDNS